MKLSKRLSPLTLVALLISMMLVVIGCTTEETNDEIVDNVEEIDATQSDIIREAPLDSEYAGVTLILSGYDLTDESDGAAAGTIVLTIAFENTTDEAVTLPFGDDAYVLRDTGGFDIVSSDTSESLITPEIPANSTIEGALEFAVTEGEATFFFQVGDYEDIEIGTLPPSSE